MLGDTGDTESVGSLERELQTIARQMQMRKRTAGRSASEVKQRQVTNRRPKEVAVALQLPPTGSDGNKSSRVTQPTHFSLRERIQAALKAPEPTPDSRLPRKRGVSAYSFTSLSVNSHFTTQGGSKPGIQLKPLTPVKLHIAFDSGCDWTRLKPANH